MAHFEEWTFEDARDALAAASRSRAGDGFDVNKAFVEDEDHWQDGAGWVGPPANATTAQLEAIEPQFTPDNVLGEALGRRTNALLKTEATIELIALDEDADDEAEDAEADQAVADLAAWWDRATVKLWEKAKQAVTRSGWAGHGALRAWIPASRLKVSGSEEEGQVTELPKVTTLAEALALIELDAPPPDAAVIYTDPDTKAQAAIVMYTTTDDATEQETDKIEVYWKGEGEDPPTFLRVLSEDGAPDEHEFQWAGLLPVTQVESDLLVTESARRLQRTLNFVTSLLARSAETAGFPERYFLNAEPPGEWSTVRNDASPLEPRVGTDGDVYYFHPVTMTLGAATANFLAGIETKDVDGNELRATPGVVFRDPTDPGYIIKSANHLRGVLLGHLKQGHLANTSTAEASGIAYEQARTDFIDDLNDLKGATDGALRDVLSAVLAIAHSMGAPDILSTHRIVVNTTVKPGPLSADERRANIEAVEARMLARKTAMARDGIEDADAELALIEDQPEEQAKHMKARAEALDALSRVEGAVARPEVVEMAGFSEDEAEVLTRAPQGVAA